MGNTGVLGSEERDVLICLHSVHNVEHLPNESYYGMATNHCADEEIAVTSDRAAPLRACLDSVISIRLHLHERGTPASQDRPVGQVSIPVREMLRHCGPAIFQTWLVLEASAPYDSVLSRAAESFRRALQAVPENVRCPRICVSLLETALEPSQWINDESTQVMYYDPLLVSHSQHLQLEQTYFRVLDGEELGLEVSAGGVARAHPSSNELSQLKRDLDSVTLEANRRIEKANENILKLKGQLRAMAEKEAPPLLRAHAEAQRRKKMVEASHEELQIRLGNEDYDEELDQLRGEVTVLMDQKAALMDSVQELYQAGGGQVRDRKSVV